MSGEGSLRSFHFHEYRQIWLFALGLSILMHTRSFWMPHSEGDEIVYATLGRDMNWDLSHYTTRDDPVVSKYPYSIYRSPLFHHPPLFPLVLKFGYYSIRDPAFVGLLFENVGIGLLLYYTWRWMVFQQMPVVWGAIAFAGITFCPLLLSSSVLLHHDALMGCFMACGLVAYLEALQRPTVGRAIIAGLLLIIGLNLRYNSLIFLPILVVLQLDHVYWSGPRRQIPQTTKPKTKIQTTNQWLVFGIVMTMVLTLGLQHYYRVLATYGTLMPSSFIQPDPDAANFSAYIKLVMERQPWKTALHLVLIYPILLAFLLPRIYAPLFRSTNELSRYGVFTPIFLYLLAVEFYFSYSQLRYFASITPCLFLGLPYLMRQQSPRLQKLFWGMAAVSLMFMFATGFGKTQMTAAESMMVVPAPFFYIPPLRAVMY